MTVLNQAPTRRPVASGLQVRVAPALGTYAAAWDALVDAAPVPSPFLRSWWIATAAGGRPHLVLVLDGEELVGGLALEERRFAGVALLRGLGGGKLCPDHLDLLAEPGRVDDVVAALRTWFTTADNHLLDIDGVVEDALLLQVLPDPLVAIEDRAPYAALVPDAEDYLAERSATFRKRIRRFERTTAGSGTTCRVVGPTEVPAALAQFRALHAAREDRRELLRHAARIERIVLAATAAGEAVVRVAERDGRCGAVQLQFVTGRRVSDYQVARSLAREFNHIGSVMTMASIRDACATGMGEIDFLRGDHAHKHSFAPSKRNVLRVRAAQGLRARALLRGLRTAAALRRRVGSLVRRLRLAGPTDTKGGGTT